MAAGEVIDSLAAVVRELAENALDAGASRITVCIWPDQWRVRLTDNGEGMTLTDLQQAARSHSTSKIRASLDLWKIDSLGFRGEALHSLAQLSDLEICSRKAGAEGWSVIYNHQGEPQSTETIAIAPGTVVTIANLFNNWHSRRDSLPPPAQQLRSVQATIHHLALCHPHVTWQVQQSDRDWFSIWAGTSAKQILPQILRDVQPSDLQAGEWKTEDEGKRQGAEGRGQKAEDVNDSSLLSDPQSPVPNPPALPLSSCSLSLLLGLPDRCHRHRLDWVKIAVNGRVVRCLELEQTVLTTLRRTLPRDRYPLCFVHLRVPPDRVDWNRHPAKAEIYLRSIGELQQAVADTIAQALHLGSANLPDSAYATRVGQLIKAAETQGAYGTGGAGNTEDTSQESASPDSLTPSLPHPLTSLKAIAQVHNMYILAEHPAGVWLVEQHIAHERVLYEHLRDRWQTVPLEPPIILNQLSGAQIEQLQRIGITVEPFGEQLWAARSAPEPLAQRPDCTDALLELSLGGDLEAALVATACRTAIRNGTPLSIPEMQTLLEEWQRTQNPRTCPHGRPIYLPLAESSLSRFFRRHWVIGKSHGI